MRLPILLACCLLAQGFSFQLEKTRPSFSDFAAKDIYRGEPARPIITKEFRSFRTMIRKGANSDVEFAGHYTIPRWVAERIATGSLSSIPSVAGSTPDLELPDFLLSGWKSMGARIWIGWCFIRTVVY
jgi:hypothetical protein